MNEKLFHNYVMVATDHTMVEDYFSRLMLTPVQSSLVLLLEEKSVNVDVIFSELTMNNHFYFTRGDGAFYSVMGFSNGNPAIVDRLTISDDGKLVEAYDFRGYPIRGYTLDWDPFLVLNCLERIDEKYCHSEGAHIIDILKYSTVNQDSGMSCYYLVVKFVKT